ncbi:class I SAM-dependent methyltransferase [Streptomyces sp. JJ36]|nr:class I SAM-dependent methyltransferase [Streptomyces sp. JJ36]
MADLIRDRLRAHPGQRIADVGAGTGLFLSRLLPCADARTPLVCVDPSQEMLDQLPDDPRLRPLRATAEELGDPDTALPYDAFDAVLVKEAVHHFADLDATLAGLAGRLAPGGRLLVVTIPPKLDYPLFQEALDRFADRQPEPEAVAAGMRRAGLAVTHTTEQYRVGIERERWLRLVGNRWMSVLSTFGDEELKRGLEEVTERHPDAWLEFDDRFAFVLGERTA